MFQKIPVFEGVGVAVAVVLAAIVATMTKKPRKRALSFSSSNLIDGSFPQDASVCAPVVNSLIMMENCPTLEGMAESVKKFYYYDRFRSRVVQDLRTGKWNMEKIEDVIISDPAFISKFIIQHTVQNEKEFFRVVDEIIATDLDGGYGEMPPWRLHRIDNKNGASAVLLRIHHVIGDGMSMVGAMAHVFFEEDGNHVKLDFIPQKVSSGDGTVNAAAINAKKAPKKNMFVLLGQFISSFFEVALKPLSAFDSDIVFTSQNKPTMVMTERRKVVYFPSVRLDVIKAIKNKAGTTLNDVMLAATSGAVQRYCKHFKDPLVDSPKMLQNRALMPFSFPRTSEVTHSCKVGMRNYWAFLSVPMPIVLGTDNLKDGTPECLTRLRECNKTTAVLKQSPLAFVTLWIQNNLLPLMPKSMAQKTAMDLFIRHTMVFSNVPGPTRVVNVCGERVLGIQAIFNNLLPQVILMSYCDKIFSNMVVDPDLVKDSDLLRQMYLDELLSLCIALDVPLEHKNGKVTTDALLGKGVCSNFQKFGLIGPAAVPDDATKQK